MIALVFCLIRVVVFHLAPMIQIRPTSGTSHFKL